MAEDREQSNEPTELFWQKGKGLDAPIVDALNALAAEWVACLDRLEASHQRKAERLDALEKRVSALETRPR